MTQKNTLRTKLADGNVAIGASTACYSTTAIEILGEHDLDFLFIDFEHNGPSIWDSLRMQEFVRAADEGDVELLVRLPSATEANHAPMIRKVLDTGVNNVVVPRVKTASEVRKVVAASKFTYDGSPGERGIGAARGSSWGRKFSKEWVRAEDTETQCGIMVETAEAVENIEDIVSIPELGFVFVGSMDLSVALGIPTETSHPRFEETVSEVRTACQDAGVPFGQLGAPNKEPKDLVAIGDQLIRVGSDIGALRAAFSDSYSHLR